MELPDTIPIFPLPNVVLFPGVLLPLHIFEERYRDMVRDADESDSKLIGMVLLRGDWKERYHERPDLFATGCAGRMVRSQRLDDGRYNIVLQGLREFEVRSEIGESSYRIARVEWRAGSQDTIGPEACARVRTLAEQFLTDRDAELARRLLDDGSMSDDLLVNFLSYALECPAMEKQALLEAPTLAERAHRLCEILEFGLGGGGFDTGGTVH